MLLTLSTTFEPATDLGYLLHKNPARHGSFELSFGRAHVFYPEADARRCTAALLVEVDPIGLVRGRQGPPGEGRSLEQYVNDRPYAASSFLSVAIARVFASAMSGRSKERPDLATAELPFEIRLAAVPCRGGEPFLRRLFEPLGYEVDAVQLPLDEEEPDWGPSRYHTVTLRARRRLSDVLTHLYVLVPVLDDDKHYWVGDDEVDKLIRHGEGWLAAHPEKETIARRYLKHKRSLARLALERLLIEEITEPDEIDRRGAGEEAGLEEPIKLNDLRLGAVVAALKQSGAKRVLDLGCGEGKLVRLLLQEKSFDEIVGVDVSHRALEIASSRLRLDRLPEMQRKRLTLLQGSLTYRDKRLQGYDAAALVEVIEHIDPSRLGALERTVFEFARPGAVVVTTPNAEYNVRFEGLPAGRFRHRDHRFEWSRAEFEAWAGRVAGRRGYSVRFLPVGPEDAEVGAPTQMAIFAR